MLCVELVVLVLYCAVTVLVLRLYCAVTVLVLRLYCAVTVLVLRLYCAVTVLVLWLYCAVTVLVLRLYCVVTVLVLRLYCVVTVLVLRLHCAVTVLVLRLDDDVEDSDVDNRRVAYFWKEGIALRSWIFGGLLRGKKGCVGCFPAISGRHQQGPAGRQEGVVLTSEEALTLDLCSLHIKAKAQ